MGTSTTMGRDHEHRTERGSVVKTPESRPASLEIERPHTRGSRVKSRWPIPESTQPTRHRRGGVGMMRLEVFPNHASLPRALVPALAVALSGLVRLQPWTRRLRGWSAPRERLPSPADRRMRPPLPARRASSCTRSDRGLCLARAGARCGRAPDAALGESQEPRGLRAPRHRDPSSTGTRMRSRAAGSSASTCATRRCVRSRPSRTPCRTPVGPRPTVTRPTVPTAGTWASSRAASSA